MDEYSWNEIRTLKSRQYDCGYCGNSVSSEKGYSCDVRDGRMIHQAYIYICHHCQRPTYFNVGGNQTPSKTFGKDVPSIDNKDINSLYNEARRSFGASAFTASTMLCRKLLMNISVSKGAEENKSFEYYVKYLSDNHFIPNGTEEWVDAIRTQGNEANHEIKLFSREDAEEILGFTEMLLRLIYEFPSKAVKYKSKNNK
jgi:hypothetical protein